MNEANTVTYDARNPQTTIPATAARAVAGRPKLAVARAYSLPAADRPAAAAGWQVREEPEYYLPDLLLDEDYDPDPELIEAAEALSGNFRQALGLLDDAINLVGVLLDAVEQDGDTRGAQATTVLEMTVECIHEAHRCVDDFGGKR